MERESPDGWSPAASLEWVSIDAPSVRSGAPRAPSAGARAKDRRSAWPRCPLRRGFAGKSAAWCRSCRSRAAPEPPGAESLPEDDGVGRGHVTVRLRASDASPRAADGATNQALPRPSTSNSPMRGAPARACRRRARARRPIARAARGRAHVVAAASPGDAPRSPASAANMQRAVGDALVSGHAHALLASTGLSPRGATRASCARHPVQLASHRLAMRSTSRISFSNPGEVQRLRAVAQRAAGSGWTSMMSPSAPAATAARAIAGTACRMPVPWRGSTTTGRCDSRLSIGHRVQVQRVAGHGLEGADAALAEDHLVVAARRRCTRPPSATP